MEVSLGREIGAGVYGSVFITKDDSKRPPVVKVFREVHVLEVGAFNELKK